MLLIAIFGAKYQIVTYIIVLINFYVISSFITSIPLVLNWSKSLYSLVFRSMMYFIVISIITFTIVYFQNGLSCKGEIIHTVADSFYFSLSMWTALGYGEVLPLETNRILSSLEALIGLIMLPLIATYIWLYCQDRLWQRSLTDKKEDLTLQLDSQNGVMRAVEDEEVLNNRIEQFNLRNCSTCGSSSLKIIKYYDIINRVSSIPKFVVKCECGKMSKIMPNTFLVVHNWNKLNKTHPKIID